VTQSVIEPDPHVRDLDALRDLENLDDDRFRDAQQD
jgi:hypothetical protein